MDMADYRDICKVLANQILDDEFDDDGLRVGTGSFTAEDRESFGTEKGDEPVIVRVTVSIEVVPRP